MLLVPAGGRTARTGRGRSAAATRAAVGAALAALPHGSARWYPGADHDLHAQHPDRLARDLLALESALDSPESSLDSPRSASR